MKPSQPEEQQKSSDTRDRPLPTFTTFSTVAVIVGIVVGVGIFRLPSIVASHSSHEIQFLLFWVAGGFVSLMGAFCYAELSSSMPNAGGEYHFLRKAFGPATGFLLSWGRMTVIQTGSIALIAFIFGDYATVLFDLGTHSASIYAAAMVVLLTLLNILGTGHSRLVQNILSSVIVFTLAVLALAGIFTHAGGGMPDWSIPDSGNGQGTFSALLSGGMAGSAMIFVLLTYGGWSEAAYLTGELHRVRRNIFKALVTGITVITTLYVLINLAYLYVLGFENLKSSEAPGHDLTEMIFGPGFSLPVVMVIILAALSTANATIITGARTNYAIGRDFRLLGIMGKWNRYRNTPVNALIVQGIIALVLVGMGAWSQQAISTIVDYTAPVFWFFLLLITISLFLFRYRNELPADSRKVPFYPLPPVLFLIACTGMLYSSLVFTGTGAAAGVAILLAGIPVYMLARRFQDRTAV